jgi:glucuronoarabinoxylan endo-1,4-beta-xylanase
MIFQKKSLPILMSCCFLFGFLSFRADPAVITLDFSLRFQTIEGFGGGFMFGVWPYGRANKNVLYDSIFNTAGCNVVRIGNNYDPQTDTVVDEIPMMREIRQKYPNVKIDLASWSPPKYLKDQDTIIGILNGEKLSLKKKDGKFVYDEYGDYWYKSVKHFMDKGLSPNWVSIQNEPDWPAAWEGCYLIPSETDKLAAYGKALDAVYKKISPLQIPLIGPDVTGTLTFGFSIKQYLDSLNQDQLVAISHHFYNGETEGAMLQFRQQFPDKPVYQTEWLTNDTIPLWEGGPMFTWYDHINVIQNALTVENVSMYLLFALAYKPASRHCLFSLDSTATGGFVTRPIYYGFKHFSKSIHRGWKRIAATVGPGADSLRVSAFAGDNDSSMAIVIINRNSQKDSVKLMGVPAAIDSGVAHQTSRLGSSGIVQNKKYSLNAIFGKNIPTFYLDPFSITTVALFNAKYPVPPEEKQGLCPISQQRISPPALPSLCVNVRGCKNIMVSFHSAPNRRYTLSLCTIAGKQIAASAGYVAAGGNVTCILNGAFASGIYTVKLANGNVAESRLMALP